jgi:hypothetical protein
MSTSLLVMTITTSLIGARIGHANMVAFAALKTVHIGACDVNVCQLSIALLTSEVAQGSSTVLICCWWARCGPTVVRLHLACHCRSVSGSVERILCLKCRQRNLISTQYGEQSRRSHNDPDMLATWKTLSSRNVSVVMCGLV